MTATRRRRPSWPRARARVRFARSAPQALDDLCRRIADRAPDALRRRADVVHSVPERGGYSPTPDGDRAWRLASGDANAWCVVDAASQAALLEAVLGGPGSSTPTAIERAITSEAVERLIADEVPRASRPVECAIERPPPIGWWRCNVDIVPHSGRTVTLQLFCAPAPTDPSRLAPAARPHAPQLDHVPMRMFAEMPAVAVPIAAIMGWARGSLVPLPAGALGSVTIAAAPRVRLALGRLGSAPIEAGRVRAIHILTLEYERAA